MTDREKALQDLLKKAEAGDDVKFADVECCFIHPDTTKYPIVIDYVIQAFRGSLDSAKALHDAVLPGWFWRRPESCHQSDVIEVIAPRLSILPDEDWAGFETHEGKHKDPARAWLVAILKALIAQEDDS